MGRLEELMSSPVYQSLQTKYSGTNDALEEALKTATTPAKLDTTQTIVEALMGVLPAIIGTALAGKRGAIAGSEAGQLGMETYSKSAKEDQVAKAAAAALEYKRLMNEKTQVGKDLTAAQLAAQKSQFASENIDQQIKAQSEAAKELAGIKHGYETEDIENRYEKARALKQEFPTGKGEKTEDEKKLGNMAKLRPIIMDAPTTKLKEAINSGETLLKLLSDPTSIHIGMASTKFVKLSGDVGNVTVVERQMTKPEAWRDVLTKIENKVTGKVKAPITAEELAAMRETATDLLQATKKAYSQRINAARKTYPSMAEDIQQQFGLPEDSSGGSDSGAKKSLEDYLNEAMK